MEMTEELLYFIWNTRRFDHTRLVTISGEEIEILKYGYRNSSSGPDFINASVKIGPLEWHGNVEMHVCTSDWKKHRHHEDEAYENVILHVVWQHDRDPTEGRVPVLALELRVDPHLLTRYTSLKAAMSWLPCQTLLDDSAMDRFLIWRDALVTARLEKKVLKTFTGLAEARAPDWDALIYHQIVIYMSGRENRECGEQLARRLPLLLIERNAHDAFAVAALVIGTAGCMEDIVDINYRETLTENYKRLSTKYNLVPMNRSSWRKFGMRSAGMPIRRLAQLAALLYQRARYFSELIRCSRLSQLYSIWPGDLPGEEAWCHLLPSQKLLTRQMKEMLIINVLLPVWFYYHRFFNPKGDESPIFDILENLPAEKNATCTKYQQLGFPMDSALDSQALLELRGQYCIPRRCASCAVGQYIFSKGQ